MTKTDLLAARLRLASTKYYGAGESDLSDAEFDQQLEELRKADPKHPFLSEVGAETPGSKVKHLRLMGSLGKVTEASALKKWMGSHECTLQTKADGATVELQFNGRRLQVAVTRGNGIEGTDVTAAVSLMPSVPKELPSSWPDGPLSIRGEVILTRANWDLVNSNSTNPRNVGTGILTRKSDLSQAHLLTFLMFDPGLDTSDEQALLQSIAASGLFQVPPSELVTAENVEQRLAEMLTSRWEGGFQFDIDGAVIKINNVQTRDALGVSGNRPRGQVAFKWEDSPTADTTVIGFSTTVGHTGLVSPVFQLEPVFLAGVTVSSALANNAAEIERLNVGVGDTVRVRRMGELIPKLVGVVKRPANRKPVTFTQCPCCGSRLGKKANADGDLSVNDYCLNENCDGRAIGKVKRWLKSNRVLGVGGELLESLLEAGVRTPADLYRVEHQALANLPMGHGRVGDSRATSILTELKSKTATLSLAQFIGSLGIPFIGRRKAQLLIEAAGGELDRLEDWNPDNIADLAGRMSIRGIVDAVTEWLAVNQPLIDDLLQYVMVKPVTEEPTPAPTPAAVGGMVFLLTGKFDVVKKEIHAQIEAAGQSFATDFTPAVTHLVQADPSPTSSKTKKALSRGIPVIGLSELSSLLAG